jgi:hypothetical protein
MPDFHEELERRTEQFRHYLELMRQRHGEIAQGNCFIIFEECLDLNDRDARQLAASKALVYQASLEVGGWDNAADFGENIVADLPTEGWKGDDSSCRFIQFSFNPRYFDLDIPNTTLFRAEAEIILRRRSGFFYVKDDRRFEHPKENVDRFNPLRKIFVPGDERSAAEEMAFVFFNVWKFPVDWRFYVTAAAFHEKTDWEKGFPIA